MEEAAEKLLEWATLRGVVVNGIAPMPLSQRRGFGMVATKPIKAKETILTVPSTLFLTLESTPEWISSRLQGASVHAILAASLCLEEEEKEEESVVSDTWRSVFPPWEKVRACMPLCWSEQIRNLLPWSTFELVGRQRSKFEDDWLRVSKAFHHQHHDDFVGKGNGMMKISRSDFLYAWILINSRTFYHTTPMTETNLHKDHHMALVPVADLFNHSHDQSHCCAVSYDATGYSFVASRSYQPGEEVLICYGRHSDDFLLVEYGFTLGEKNPYDETCLDHYLVPLFSPSQSLRLQESGFWKGYMLDAETACYRTLTALRIFCFPPHHWSDILDGSRDEDGDRPRVDAELRPLLAKYETDIRQRLILIDQLDDDDDDDDEARAQQKASLRSRCIAVKNILLANVARLQS